MEGNGVPNLRSENRPLEEGVEEEWGTQGKNGLARGSETAGQVCLPETCLLPHLIRSTQHPKTFLRQVALSESLGPERGVGFKVIPESFVSY